MGRPRKPVALHVAASGGVLRKAVRERAKVEPHVPDGLGAPPAGLTDAQAEVWNRLAAAAPDGLLTAMDRDLLEGVAVLVVARAEARRMFNEAGGLPVARGAEGGLVADPILRQFKQLSLVLAALGREVGMSPAARTHISMSRIEEPEDPLERFLTPERR